MESFEQLLKVKDGNRVSVNSLSALRAAPVRVTEGLSRKERSSKPQRCWRKLGQRCRGGAAGELACRRISKVMMKRLCIVITSGLQRCFSRMGQTFSERRNRLNPEKVRVRIFLNANLPD